MLSSLWIALDKSHSYYQVSIAIRVIQNNVNDRLFWHYWLISRNYSFTNSVPYYAHATCTYCTEKISEFVQTDIWSNFELKIILLLIGYVWLSLATARAHKIHTTFENIVHCPRSWNSRQWAPVCSSAEYIHFYFGVHLIFLISYLLHPHMTWKSIRSIIIKDTSVL